MSPEDLVKSLRKWTATQDAPVRAAVELLIDHDHWLLRKDFIKSCVVTSQGVKRIVWSTVGQMLKGSEFVASSSQLVVLDVAVLLAQDGLGLVRLDRTNRQLVAWAVADSMAVPR